MVFKTFASFRSIHTHPYSQMHARIYVEFKWLRILFFIRAVYNFRNLIIYAYEGISISLSSMILETFTTVYSHGAYDEHIFRTACLQIEISFSLEVENFSSVWHGWDITAQAYHRTLQLPSFRHIEKSLILKWNQIVLRIAAGMWIIVHSIGQIFPFAFFLYNALIMLTLLIPVQGRAGPATNPDLVVGVVVILSGILLGSLIVPILCIFRRPVLVMCSFLAVFVVFVILMATPIGFPYRYNGTQQRFWIYVSYSYVKYFACRFKWTKKLIFTAHWEKFLQLWPNVTQSWFGILYVANG